MVLGKEASEYYYYYYYYLFICHTLYANYTNNICIHVHTGDAKAMLAIKCVPAKRVQNLHFA